MHIRILDYSINTNNMKRFLIALFICSLTFGMGNVQAQSKSSKSSKTSKSSKNSKSKKKKNVAVDTVALVQLPYNSNDCIFAIPINADQEYGPTTAPQGAGRVMEVMADKKHPNMPEFEHNVTWYKVDIPYNGKLNIAINQQNVLDDYDMLVYRYTDVYFSNHIQCNKVLPVAVNMSAVDSSLAAKPKKQAFVSTGDAKADAKAKAEANRQARLLAEKNKEMGTIGMHHEATDITLTKESTNRHIKSIDVRKGETYYIMLDNNTAKGSGHTIKVSIHVDAFNAPIFFYDAKAKKNVEVNLTILEKNTNNRAIVQDEHFRGRNVSFVPGYNYTLYAKKPGYFSVFLDFNADCFKQDTMMRIKMNRAEKGTVYPISEVYFEDGESNLLPASDSVLMNYVQMFKNHPDVHFTIKGYVQTYGIDLEADQLMSLNRAKSVKDYFVRNGVAEGNMKTAGMTITDIKRAATAAFDNKGADVKVELIITSVEPKNNP